MHFFLAAGLAWVLRGNVVAALLGTFFGNPLTFPLIALSSINLGHWMLGNGLGAALVDRSARIARRCGYSRMTAQASGNSRRFFEKTKKIECDVVTLDEHLGHIERLALIKCDIEGADLFAMRGARRLIEKHKPVVITEITP